MTTISREDVDVLFREAGSYNVWLPKKVPEETLHRLYDLLKWAPTSANSCPARFIFLCSAKSNAVKYSPGRI
jgi:3-hydroxypropanoate dehydrogenase